MNIFTVLGQGHGRINEPNVSAFLAYLLDPKKDHGLNDNFLKLMLDFNLNMGPNDALNNSLLGKNGKIRNMSTDSDFEVEVIPEQAFYIQIVKKEEEGDSDDEEDELEKIILSEVAKNEDDKKIVDIVILLFEKGKVKVQTAVNRLLTESNKGELKRIFLIENKINDYSTTAGQLGNQVNYSIDTLKRLLNKEEQEIKNMLSCIFISPLGTNSTTEFEKLQGQITGIPTSHLHWDSENADEPSLITFFQKILDDEAKGNIGGINEYTKYTIKSFIAFIRNNFKSAIEEKLLGQNPKNVFDKLEDLKLHFPALLSESLWLFVEIFDKYLSDNKDISTKYSTHHPVAIFLGPNHKKGTKIFGFSISGINLPIDLILKNNIKLWQNRDVINAEMQALGFEARNLGPKDLRIQLTDLSMENCKLIFEQYFRLYKI